MLYFSDVSRKRWSSFGPNLINVFDKLLLGSAQKMKPQDVRMKRSQTTGSSLRLRECAVYSI